MGKINAAEKITNEKFLNLYKVHAENKEGKQISYLVASRAKEVDELKAISDSNKPDAVAILGITEDEKVVLIRQYRYAIGDYIYELPAGLVDEGEDIYDTAIREMKEETGLDLTPQKVPFSRGFYSSTGMTDESCAIVFGEVKGTISKAGNEANEEIEILLVGKDEIVRILKEEKVCMETALCLMNVICGE